MPSIATLNLNLGMGGTAGDAPKTCLEISAEQRVTVTLQAETKIKIQVSATSGCK